MKDSVSALSQPNLSDHLAIERTFLAWIRTGLSLMGFGFVVARFGLFLQELQVIRPQIQVRSFGFSLWFGTSLIAVGVVVNVLSTKRYLRLLKHLNRGETNFVRPSAGAIGVALFLALVGLAMAIYLISV
jgi:putative membrane protein